jgi:hypothetical protein
VRPANSRSTALKPAKKAAQVARPSLCGAR